MCFLITSCNEKGTTSLNLSTSLNSKMIYIRKGDF